MKKLTRTSAYGMLIALLLSTSGCVSLGPSTLKFEDSLAPSAISSRQITANITLEMFKDLRTGNKGPEVIGGKRAGLGLPIKDVSVDRPVAEIIHNEFRRELTTNGYSNNNAAEPLTITGEILDFRVGTDVTALYWDVYGEVKIKVEIKNSKGESTKIGPYSAKNIERTYSGPSDEIMEKTILAALHEVINKILSDNNFTFLISKKMP